MYLQNHLRNGGRQQHTGIDYNIGKHTRRWPLEDLYVCDHCNEILCRYQIAVDYDSYYCVQCLESLPPSEAFAQGNRCSKCFDCPKCNQVLQIMPFTAANAATQPTTAGEDESRNNDSNRVVFQFGCSYCAWDSASIGLVAAKADMLPGIAAQWEKDIPQRSEVKRLVENLRRKAAESKGSPIRSLTKGGLGTLDSLRSLGPSSPLVAAPQWNVEELFKSLASKEAAVKERSIWQQCASPSSPVSPTRLRLQSAHVTASEASTNTTTPLRLHITLAELLEPVDSEDHSQTNIDVCTTDNNISVDTDKYKHISQNPWEISAQRRIRETDSNSRHFYLARKPFLTKRSHRCLSCQRLVVKANINPTAQYREKNNSALFLIPVTQILCYGPITDVRGLSSVQTVAGKFTQIEMESGAWCDLQLTNHSDSAVKVSVSHPPVEVSRAVGCTFTAAYSVGEFTVPAKEEYFAEEPVEGSTVVAQEDPPFIIKRNKNAVTIRLDLYPMEGVTTGNEKPIARFCMQMDFERKGKPIPSTQVISLGKVVVAES
eukprot:Lankesteria_metandrocarpae@DN940_c0_g1_i1.p1